jgi:hypothetical protein
LILVLVFLLIGIIYYQETVGLGNGYQYISGRSDDFHIVKDERVVIKSTIVDLIVVSNYVVGLRLPSQRLECEGGAALKIRIENKKEYFILDTELGLVYYYSTDIEFKSQLQNLGIRDGVSLDYTKFDSTWNTYANYYKNQKFIDCVSIPQT